MREKATRGGEQSLSPIFLWAKSKQNSLTEAHSNRSFGNDILTIFSLSGKSTERSYNSSLNKPTITTLPSNSRLKFLKRKLHSWTLWFIKATDSLPNQCSMYAFLLVSPTKSKKRFHQRRGPQTSPDKLNKSNI